MPSGKYKRKPYMKSYSPNKSIAIGLLLQAGMSWNYIIEVLKVSRSRVALVAKNIKVRENYQ
jgi:hypothetical protein